MNDSVLNGVRFNMQVELTPTLLAVALDMQRKGQQPILGLSWSGNSGEGMAASLVIDEVATVSAHDTTDVSLEHATSSTRFTASELAQRATNLLATAGDLVLNMTLLRLLANISRATTIRTDKGVQGYGAVITSKDALDNICKTYVPSMRIERILAKVRDNSAAAAAAHDITVMMLDLIDSYATRGDWRTSLSNWPTVDATLWHVVLNDLRYCIHLDSSSADANSLIRALNALNSRGRVQTS